MKLVNITDITDPAEYILYSKELSVIDEFHLFIMEFIHLRCYVGDL